MGIRKTEAIVLERRDYRETSFLLTLLTEDSGKMFAQAKGARRGKGKFGTNFIPFSSNVVVYYERANDLQIIGQADLLDAFDRITGCWERLGCAGYFTELIAHTLPFGQENRELFFLLKNFLNFLNKADKIQHLYVIPAFETRFLTLSGFRPRFDQCVSCAGSVGELTRFSHACGGLLCRDCFGVDQQARPVMKGTIASMRHLEDMDLCRLNNFRFQENVSRELTRLLRDFIDFHIGWRFKSMDFLGKMRKAHA